MNDMDEMIRMTLKEIDVLINKEISKYKDEAAYRIHLVMLHKNMDINEQQLTIESIEDTEVKKRLYRYCISTLSQELFHEKCANAYNPKR